jgi:GNAT superfamily N-acetyltransferase
VQRRGLGSELLQPVLARCDAEQKLAYLETARAENLPFYARHGFRVVHVLDEPGFPKLWLMLREPAALLPGSSRLLAQPNDRESP